MTNLYAGEELLRITFDCISASKSDSGVTREWFGGKMILMTSSLGSNRSSASVCKAFPMKIIRHYITGFIFSHRSSPRGAFF